MQFFQSFAVLSQMWTRLYGKQGGKRHLKKNLIHFEASVGLLFLHAILSLWMSLKQAE